MMNRIGELQWKKFPVLSDGFVCLVDVMGSDHDIVNAARVSYLGEGAEVEERSEEKDRTLIRYLMRHRHTTPFEMAEIKLLVRVPMDCWRQWIRHRTANVNEYSTRYTEAIDSMDVTPPDQWRSQSKANKQGSGSFLPASDSVMEDDGWSGEELSQEEMEFHIEARKVYEKRLLAGVAREQARKDLPLSTYSEAYWKIDLHNLLHFLSLRMHSHAQKEIRDYAKIIGEKIVAPLFPLVWEAFVDYRLEGIFLSSLDQKMLSKIIIWPKHRRRDGFSHMVKSLEFFSDWRKDRSRERDECYAKLVQLGIIEDNL